jgi:hypothetical protein
MFIEPLVPIAFDSILYLVQILVDKSYTLFLSTLNYLISYKLYLLLLLLLLLDIYSNAFGFIVILIVVLYLLYQ